MLVDLVLVMAFAALPAGLAAVALGIWEFFLKLKGEDE